MGKKKKQRILYSVGTRLAYYINTTFYNGEHYVWCTDTFHSPQQPPTSDPKTIIRQFIRQIATGDRHQQEINSNKVGLLRGAEAKLREGVITEEDYHIIRYLVAKKKYQDFMPVLYIIYADKVRGRCLEVPTVDKASDHSIEYKIVDLKHGEFDLIEFDDLLEGVMPMIDKKAGE